MIKLAKKNILTKLTIIARQSLLFGKMADVWHQIIGIPVHKKGRDSTICNSFRIVALQDNLDIHISVKTIRNIRMCGKLSNPLFLVFTIDFT